MKIQQASIESGLPAKTLRFYEERGLVNPARLENGYREYSHSQLRELVFLRRARQFGFSLKDCEGLLHLLRNPVRQSHDVHQLASDKLTEMDKYIGELQQLRHELAGLVAACPDDDSPDCTIIDRLVGGSDCE